MAMVFVVIGNLLRGYKEIGKMLQFVLMVLIMIVEIL